MQVHQSFPYILELCNNSICVKPTFGCSIQYSPLNWYTKYVDNLCKLSEPANYPRLSVQDNRELARVKLSGQYCTYRKIIL